MRLMSRLYRQLAVFLLSLCCLTAQSVSVVAAPCSMSDHGSNHADTEHAAAMPAMDEHAHHAQAQAGHTGDKSAARDCCNDQENCSMTSCYAAAVMLNSDFSMDDLKATSAHRVARVSNVLYAHSTLFKPPISL